jgi:hypothetical protein
MSNLSNTIKSKYEQLANRKKIKNTSLFVYYQIYPKCGEPLVGIKESTRGELYLNPNNVEGMVFLIKDKIQQGRNSSILYSYDPTGSKTK